MNLTDDVWGLITENSTVEVFPFLLKKYDEEIKTGSTEMVESFHKKFSTYLRSLSEEDAISRTYDSLISLPVGMLAGKSLELVKELRFFDSKRCQMLLKSHDFVIQKRGLIVAVSDKSSYNQGDVEEIEKMIEIITSHFPERGKRSHKKTLLSSKEKEVWTCECGKVNDIGENCGNCEKDIFGFTVREAKPAAVIAYLTEKVDLISNYLN